MRLKQNNKLNLKKKAKYTETGPEEGVNFLSVWQFPHNTILTNTFKSLDHQKHLPESHLPT